MRRKYLLLLLMLKILPGFAQKEFITEDKIYEENIKTVLIYPTNASTTSADMINPPIVDLNQGQMLKLEFDEIGDQYGNYFLKIVNCNADWSISQLNSIQYLNEYNEYQISDRQNSFNTRVSFIHYKILLPKIKISGNYIATVYRNSDDKDIILTRRFVIFESQIPINTEIKFPLNVQQRNTGQQVDFFINLSSLEVVNPLQNIKTYLRQNYRWDNAKVNLKPSFYNETSNLLEYRFFNGESVFNGLNEFRYFDIRSNRFNGQNVGKASFDSKKTEIILMDDYNRSGRAYSFYSDLMNGKYFVQNYESGDSETQPDYAYVTFILNCAKINDKVFVLGEFNFWKTNESSEMIYNTAINKYTCRVLLKQGQYNYMYTIGTDNKSNESTLEGSFNVTQNVYDIIVYYRPVGAVSDHVLGYKITNYLGR